MSYALICINFCRTTALSVRTLLREGVTHIVNAAMACSWCQEKNFCGTCVLTKPSYYAHSNIKFKGVEAIDDRYCQLYRHFDEVANFMDEALASGGKLIIILDLNPTKWYI